MTEPVDPKSPRADWSPDMLALARRELVVLLEDKPSGEIRTLSEQIVARVAAVIGQPLDEDALSDDLSPFELLERVLSAHVEEANDAFLGPSWCAYSVYRLDQGHCLVIEDQIEAGGYEIQATADSLDEAKEVIRQSVAVRLSNECTIAFTDEAT